MQGRAIGIDTGIVCGLGLHPLVLLTVMKDSSISELGGVLMVPDKETRPRLTIMAVSRAE